jgi:hypothetical protein
MIVSVSALAGMMGVPDARAAYSEFESFHLAVVSRDKQTALAFIEAFPRSPLIDDLIVMLPRAVAQEVCAGLPGGGARVEDACRRSTMPSGPRDVADSGTGDAAMAPAAGPDAGKRELAGAGSRPTGAAGEQPAGSTARVLLPSAPDSPAAAEDDSRKTQTARTDAETAPKARGAAAPPGPRPGSDPGSDPGSVSPPSRWGSDPGSDSGSESGRGAARDSHN